MTTINSTFIKKHFYSNLSIQFYIWYFDQIKIFMSLQTTFRQDFSSNLREKIKTEFQQQNKMSSKRASTQNMLERQNQTNETANSLFDRAQFPSLTINQNRTLELSFNLYSQIQNQISNEISKGIIEISFKKAQLPAYSQRKVLQKQRFSQDSVKQKLFQMQRKKQETLNYLKILQQQEINIKRKSVSFRHKKQQQLGKSRKRQRSYFSPEQKKQVKKMLRRNLGLQQQLKQKTMNYLKNYSKITQQRKQKQIEQTQRQKQLHRSIVEQNQKSAQKKRKQRDQFIDLGNKKFKEIKSKKYLYEKIKQNDQQKEIEEDQNIKQKLQKIKMKMQVSTYDEIKQHQDKYNQIMKSKVSMRNSLKINHTSQENQTKQVALKKKIQQNYFTKLVKAQMELKKQQEEASRKRPLQFKQKIKLFSEQCDAQIKPKIKITQESRFIPFQRNQSVNSLNYFEQRNKGCQYLSMAKKLKKCETIQEQRAIKSKIKQKIGNKITYKNYLTQVKRYSQSDQNPQNTRKQFQNFLQKQGTISQFDSLHKAVVMAESMVAKSKKSKNQKLIDSVQNKINLLKMII